MLDEIKKKHPVNSRGMTVIPCMALTPENTEDWMLGLTVTIGLQEVGTPTSQGKLVGYDDSHLWVLVGTKKKKLPYNPEDIQLCVYQFESKILFSNENIIAVPPDDKKEVDPPEKKGDNASGARGTQQKTKRKKKTSPKALFGL